MKNRIELAKYFAELGFKKGAEIGVAKGYYSKVLLDNIPDLQLLCIDTWDEGVKPRHGHYEQACETLSAYPGATIICKTSFKAVKDVPDESLDFVYLDADHRYKAIKGDINKWAKKVRSGGIVAGHDYVLSTYGTVDVIRAVDEYVAKHGLELHLTDYNQEEPHHDDRQPSWYFVKP